MAWAPLTLRPGHAAPPLRSPARLAAPSPLAIAVGTWKPVGAPPTHPRAGPAPPLRSPAGQSIPLPRHRVATRPARVVQFRCAPTVASRLPRALHFPHRRVPITVSRISGRRTTASCLGLSHLRSAPLRSGLRAVRCAHSRHSRSCEHNRSSFRPLRSAMWAPHRSLRSLSRSTQHRLEIPTPGARGTGARAGLPPIYEGQVRRQRAQRGPHPQAEYRLVCARLRPGEPGRIHAKAPVPARSSRYALHSLRLAATLAPASLPARRGRNTARRFGTTIPVRRASAAGAGRQRVHNPVCRPAPPPPLLALPRLSSGRGGVAPPVLSA